ncbi:hypothetical protein RND81_12G077300 [Saponaria officinalis]|uniref:Uncharacterized protein n=1 Tax=Saponaria officinalis TaxID=3572 RepID=A0AAW1H7U4_SAPOF
MKTQKSKAKDNNKRMATSWVKTITSPFKKACIFLNHQPSKHNKSKIENERRVMALEGEVMACTYDDVQVMWSMVLDKSKSTPCTINS